MIMKKIIFILTLMIISTFAIAQSNYINKDINCTFTCVETGTDYFRFYSNGNFESMYRKVLYKDIKVEHTIKYDYNNKILILQVLGDDIVINENDKTYIEVKHNNNSTTYTAYSVSNVTVPLLIIEVTNLTCENIGYVYWVNTNEYVIVNNF